MAILDAVFANKSGQTPQDAERRRRMAQALIESGSGGKPPSSGLELAGRLAMTLTGQYQAGKADRMDREGQARGNQALVDALYGPSSSAAPPQPSIPMTGAAKEVSGTSPGVDISGDKQTFIDSLLPAAIEEGKRTGVDPRIIVAQAAQETGWGKSAPGNNYFGVKSHGQDGGNNLVTTEYVNGAPVKTRDSFRAYGSPADSVRGYGDFILQNPRYTDLRNAQGLDAQLDALGKSGYATDPNYSSSVGAIARGINIPNQVASLDPTAGMQPPSPAGSPTMPSPVTTTGRQPMQGPTQPAPALPPATTVTNPPPVAAQPAQPPQQVAQALMAPPQPSAPAGVPREKIAELLRDPYTAEAGQMLLMQEMKRKQGMQEAQYEQQLKQSDPAYQQGLQKGAIELENLQHPKMSPAEEATNAREQQKMAFEREKFDAEVKKGQWQKLTDGRLYNQTTGDFRDAPPPVPGSTPVKLDDISGMRKEIQQLPSYKNLAQAAPIYKAMAETAGRNSKASDLNLVYGLGKIMDPNSVVREGEMVMVKNTASLPDWLQGAIASLNGGAALTPETRQAIMTEAYGRVKGYNDEFQQNMGQYQGIVQRNGINPADVIPATESFEPWKAAPAPSAAQDDNDPAPEGMDPAIWKFVPAEDRKLWRK